MIRAPLLTLLLIAVVALAACGGGGGSSAGGGVVGPPPAQPLYPVPAAEALAVVDVQQIVAQSVAEAQARGAPAVVAVTDRLGNVLAVYAMTGAPTTATLRPGPAGNIGLQGAVVPAAAAAIAKAVTGAYLSSGGNAFSSRTASMIVQTTFPPGQVAVGLGSGPLYGVQFSSLPCSDLSQRFGSSGAGAFIGPKRSPLGLAADPGGFPLYKNGVLVGGVGIKADGDYGFDPNVLQTNAQQLGEEAIALAGTIGFDAPASIRADQISVNGTLLIYSNATTASFMSNPAAAPGFGSLPPTAGVLTPVAGYYAGGVVLPGQAYGAEASGIRKSTPSEFTNPDAFILTDGSGVDRYPVRGGSDAVPSPLTPAEVAALLQQAFSIMSQARAQIRQPLNSRAQVTISVVDTNGVVLGIVRSPDAPLFGIDVSLQKARTASFFSGPFAASDLGADPDMIANDPIVGSYVSAVQKFLAMPNALTGATAFSARSIGNLERPQFPDGQVGGPPGPLSPPIATFNPFDTGLQTDFVAVNLVQHVAFVASGGAKPDTPQVCGDIPGAGAKRLANGVQIFPGGFPIYRGAVLVGGIGVSGDGVNQDDLISFLGLDGAATQLHTIQNAAAGMRADQLVISQGGSANRLLYVQCPASPFLNSSVQNACQGK
ncbi:MAG TPA: heme-binding protein [Caulobacteraceae bacterium]